MTETFPFRVIDLTHTIETGIPTWDNTCGFEHILHCDYNPKQEYKFRAHKLHMSESIGTHMDAPAHCIPGGNTIEQVQLEDLIRPCVVVDVSQKANERYRVSVNDILSFESINGVIPPHSFILIRTGWDQFWKFPEKYRNNYFYPSVSKEAAEFLLEDRQIAGLGIDTLSPDRPEDGFPVHVALLGAGKYIVENVANSKVLPSTGSHTLALPIKTKNGTEAPIRFIALVPKLLS